MTPEMRQRLRGAVGVLQPDGTRKCFVLEPEVEYRDILEAAEQYIVWLEYVYGLNKSHK